MSATEWKPLYKVGDKLRVIDRKHGHDFEIGEEIEVSQIDHGSRDYLCDGNEDCWWLTEDEVELISKN